MSEGKIKVSLHAPGYARIKCFGLTNARFREFREAAEGALYVRELRAKVTPLDRVPAILVRLRRARFHVEASDDIREALRERSAQEWLDKAALIERISRVGAEMTTRTGDRMFPYQRTGSLWLARGHGRLLADQMGLGKTLQVLVALPANVPVVVVAPAVAKGDWRAQARWWRPNLRVQELSGRKSFRWPAPGEVLLTNYEILPDIHDREGVTGRVCNGHFPPKPCLGCKSRVVFVGAVGPGLPPPQAMTVTDGHKKECEEREFMQKPEECPGCHPLLSQAPPNAVFVCDEAQKIKNPKARQTKRCRALCRAVRRAQGRVWLVSGTPLENQPKDLWALAKCAGEAESTFGSWDEFVALFKGVKLEYGYEWGLPGDEIRERLQRFMLRRLKRDVLPQLPTKMRHDHQVELDGRTLRQVDDLIRASGRTIEEVADLLSREDIEFGEMSAVRSQLATAKIPAMLEKVAYFEEQCTPLVLFSAHRAPIDEMRGRPGWVVITGDENAEEKAHAADAFQNGYVADPDEPHVVDRRDVRRLVAPRPGPRADRGSPVQREAGATDEKCDHPGYLQVEGYDGAVCEGCGIVFPVGVAITIASGGVSLTLTRAHHELFVDKPWKPTALEQAEDRCVRIGQTRGTVIESLVANHALDLRVNAILDQKMRLITASVDKAADVSELVVTEEDLALQEREEQEAIAFGRAVRRPALNAEERDAFDALHAYTFDSRSDERLATDLAEQAEAFASAKSGPMLSPKQWALVVRVARRGRPPGSPPPEPPKPPSAPPSARRSGTPQASQPSADSSPIPVTSTSALQRWQARGQVGARRP